MLESGSAVGWANLDMPQTLLMFWLAHSLDHVAQIAKVDAPLMERLLQRGPVHGRFVGVQAKLQLHTNTERAQRSPFRRKRGRSLYDFLTNAGIWWVTTNAAASLSSLCCSFMDLLSLAGKDTPGNKRRNDWTRSDKHSSACAYACVVFFTVPGENTLLLKRISKMMSLTDPTALHAARTAFVPRESPAIV